jgi:hypothetical protein
MTGMHHIHFSKTNLLVYTDILIYKIMIAIYVFSKIYTMCFDYIHSLFTVIFKNCNDKEGENWAGSRDPENCSTMSPRAQDQYNLERQSSFLSYLSSNLRIPKLIF